MQDLNGVEKNTGQNSPNQLRSTSTSSCPCGIPLIFIHFSHTSSKQQDDHINKAAHLMKIITLKQSGRFEVEPHNGVRQATKSGSVPQAPKARSGERCQCLRCGLDPVHPPGGYQRSGSVNSANALRFMASPLSCLMAVHDVCLFDVLSPFEFFRLKLPCAHRSFLG
jgi:hypothetical protein